MSTRRKRMEPKGFPETLETVDMARIDLRDRTFAVAFPEEADDRLAASVRDWGLLLPPILLEREQGGYRVVAGNRRLPAAVAAGRKKVGARVLRGAREERELFLLNVTENSATRPLNQMERSRILLGLSDRFGAGLDEILAVMPLLQVPPSPRILTRYLKLSRLIPPLQRYLIDRDLSPVLGSRIAGLRPPDQEALYTLLAQVPLGGNRLAEVVELLDELCLRDGTTVADLLAGPPVQEILDAPKLTHTQRRGRLKEYLVRMRFPTLSERTRRIRRLLKAGPRTPGIRLEPPPFLEGSSLEAGFAFESIRELRDKARGLLDMASDPGVEEALRLLREPEGD